MSDLDFLNDSSSSEEQYTFGGNNGRKKGSGNLKDRYKLINLQDNQVILCKSQKHISQITKLSLDQINRIYNNRNRYTNNKTKHLQIYKIEKL